MDHFCRLASMLLNEIMSGSWTWTKSEWKDMLPRYAVGRGDEYARLASVLSQHCQNEKTFERVKHAILVNLADGATRRDTVANGPKRVIHIDADGRKKDAVPPRALRELVEATRMAVGGFSSELMKQTVADLKLAFLNNTLYVRGRSTKAFRAEEKGRGRQITILEAAQSGNWVTPIPLHSLGCDEEKARDALKKLNVMVGKWVKFSVLGGKIRWKLVDQ